MAMPDEYLLKFGGSFTSALRWEDFDNLWERLSKKPQNWFVYAIGEEPPSQIMDEQKILNFLTEINLLLKAEHDEDYCGIVYADDLSSPSMIKIYDPNNLGVSCGYSETPPLPGWVLSKIKPIDLQSQQILPKNRQRWWRKLFS